MTRPKNATRPTLPPNCPLQAYADGSIGKKIDGVQHRFGRWTDDVDACLQRYYAHLSGVEQQQPVSHRRTVEYLMGHYLMVQRERAAGGEIKAGTVHGMERTVAIIKRALPNVATRDFDKLTPADWRVVRAAFSKSKTGGPVSPSTVDVHIKRAKAMARWLYSEGLLENSPRFGSDFKLTKRQRIEADQRNAEKFYRDGQMVMKVMDATKNPMLKASILLGLNAAFGPTDICTARLTDFDLENGWYTADRHKTGVRRAARLWTATVDAIRLALKKRPRPAEGVDAGLLFLTRYGNAYSAKDGAVNSEFKKACKRVGVPGSFYWLRHTFATVAGIPGDVDAVAWVMGHRRRHIRHTYSHEIPRQRLERLAGLVWQWYTETGLLVEPDEFWRKYS